MQMSLTPARHWADIMSEEDLSQSVADLCKLLGLLAFHTRNSRGTRAGYPDWHIIAPRRGHMWRELKSHGGRLTGAQFEVMDALHELGEDVSVWRPDDWLSGRIRRELTELSRRRPAGRDT